MKIKCVCIISFLLIFCINSNAQNTTKEISEKQYEIIKEETLRKVTELNHYITVITDKSILNEEIHKQAVTDAVKLFQNEDKIIQVSNIKSTSVSEQKVRAYFNKIRVLKYSKIDIKWYDVEYVSELKKGADNRYYGIVTVFQKFTGYSGDNVSYTDITQKNIEIIVDVKEDPYGGKSWVVFLGNMSVEETK